MFIILFENLKRNHVLFKLLFAKHKRILLIIWLL